MRLRNLLFLLGAFLCGPALGQPFPSPTYSAINVNGPATTGALVASSAAVSGPSTLGGGGTFMGSFGGPTFFQNFSGILTPATTGTLPLALAAGQLAWVTDCLNGSQTTGFGTGCIYRTDDNLNWIAEPVPSNLTMTIGGQGIFLGGATANQGNGNLLQLGTSATPGIAGQCAQFDANLNIVPAGSGCGGGGGGSGTVSSGTINQLGVYAAAGTTISGLATANNGVLVTSGGGVPSIATTLPSALTIPSPTITNATNTGTTTAVTLNMSGVLTTTAGIAGAAGFNVPQGVAPTSPANGNIWATSAGLFARYGGVTQGPFVGLAGLSATSPLTYNNSTGVFACATCATTTSGGALTATAPMAISSGGVISIGTTIGAAEFFADSTVVVHNDTYPLPMDTWQWATGTIDSVTYDTGGTSTPSFQIALQINGTNVTSCNGLTVSSATRTTTTCTALNAITSGQHPTLVISATAGSPSSSLVQINYHHSNP